MLKVRIIPTLLAKEEGLVKGVGFQSWRRVGIPLQTMNVYNLREVDELIVLDIAATPAGRGPDFVAIDELADGCFVPLTVGGGVRDLDDVRRLLMVGADKVALNTAAVAQPSLIRQVADRFGSQCVVVAIDFRRHPDGHCQVVTQCGSCATGLNPVEFARQAEKAGAGEILLTSVDRDGTMTGYDVAMTRQVCEAVSIPVIASGGAGSYADFAEVLREGKASAVAAASMFHFTQQTPLEAKRYLAHQGFPVRLR